MDLKQRAQEDRDPLRDENAALKHRQRLGNVLLEYFTVLLQKEEKKHRYLLSTRDALRVT